MNFLLLFVRNVYPFKVHCLPNETLLYFYFLNTTCWTGREVHVSQYCQLRNKCKTLLVLTQLLTVFSISNECNSCITFHTGCIPFNCLYIHNLQTKLHFFISTMCISIIPVLVLCVFFKSMLSSLLLDRLKLIYMYIKLLTASFILHISCNSLQQFCSVNIFFITGICHEITVLKPESFTQMTTALDIC